MKHLPALTGISVLLMVASFFHFPSAPTVSDDLLRAVVAGSDCNYPYDLPGDPCGSCDPTGIPLEWERCDSATQRHCQYFPCGTCFKSACVEDLAAPCPGQLMTYDSPDCDDTGAGGAFCHRTYSYAVFDDLFQDYVYCPGS